MSNIEDSVKKGVGRELVGGAVWLTFSLLLVKIIGFIYKVPLAHLLTDEGMGYFNSAYTIFTFFYMICSGGIPKAVAILVTEMKVRGREDVAVFILKSLGVALFIIGSVFATALVVFSASFANFIGNSLSRFSLVCIAPTLAFVGVGGVFRGYLNGIGKLAPIGISQLIEGAIKFVLGLFFAICGIRLGYSLPLVSAMTILGITVGTMFSSVYLFFCVNRNMSKFKECKFTSSNERSNIIKRIIIIATPITLTSALSGFSAVVDLGLIMRGLMSIGYTEAEANGLYGNFTTLVIPMLNFATAMLSPIAVAALPHLTEKHTVKCHDELNDSVSGFMRVTMLLAAPAAFAMLFFSKEILYLLFADQSASIAFLQLSLISPSIIFIAALTLINTLLEATGNVRAPLYAMLGGAAVKLAVSYLLISDVRFGISGATIGTNLSYLTSLIIASVFMVKKTSVRLDAVFKSIGPIINSILAILPCKFVYERLSGGRFSLKLFICFSVLSALMYIGFSFISTPKKDVLLKKLSYLTKNAN